VRAALAGAALALTACAGGVASRTAASLPTVVDPGCPSQVPSAKLDARVVADLETRLIARTCIYGVDEEEHAAIAKAVRSRPGERLLLATVREDMRVLMAAGHVDDVDVSAMQSEGGVLVSFALKARPRIAEVVFEGAPMLEKYGFPKRVMVEKERYLSMGDVYEAKRLIVDDYRKRGYRSVSVNASTEGVGPNRARLKFVVVEGPLSKIGTISVVGASKLTADDVGKASQVDVGVALDEQQIDRGGVAIQELYLDHGMIQVEVTPSLGDPTSDGRTPLTWNIREGEVFRIGTVTVGNVDGSPNKFPMPKLKSKKGVVFSRTAIESDVTTLIDAFAVRHQIVTVASRRVIDMQKRTVDVMFDATPSTP
jgi:outer membrane protein insertion porin family